MTDVQAAPLLTLCAWCGKVIADGVRDSEGRASHGICAPCADAQMARIRAMEKR